MALKRSNDWFGYSLAAGNFNGDPYDDLAVGVPNEDLWIDGTEYTNVGVTQVFYGSSDSISLSNEQFWQQDGEYSIGDMYGSNPEDGDKFGTTLTTGDFNGDGYSELVVGAPNEGFAEIGGNVGSVNVIYGSDNGLGIPNHQWLYHDLAIGDDGSVLGSLVGDASFNTYFGQAITTADLTTMAMKNSSSAYLVTSLKARTMKSVPSTSSKATRWRGHPRQSTLDTKMVAGMIKAISSAISSTPPKKMTLLGAACPKTSQGFVAPMKPGNKPLFGKRFLLSF